MNINRSNPNTSNLTRPAIDHQGHLELSHSFNKLRALFLEIAQTIWETFPKKHRVFREFDKIDRSLLALQHHLDGHFHSVTTEEEFNQCGHVYYMHPRKRAHVDLADWIYSLDPRDYKFRKPERGEFLIGLCERKSQSGIAPTILQINPETGFVRNPTAPDRPVERFRFYMPMSNPPVQNAQIAPATTTQETSAGECQ